MSAAQASLRAAILGDLRKAVEGRGAIPATPPEGPMLTAFSSDPVVEFRHNLESVSGEVHMVQGWAEVPFLLESLALEAGWQSLVVPEEALRARLSGDGSSLLRGEPLPGEGEAVVTGCAALAASTGSVVVTSAMTRSRKAFVWPGVHIVVAREQQIAATLEEAFDATLKTSGTQDPSMITIITGPSRTADIEKTLVLGAHGPCRLVVILVREL